ncbi:MULTISPECIES: hypothetical protein [Mesorhizobium]|uniref:hypothetical protein n=1 Tax=Mesorhizobium TaxID=68287 RepID=UPI0003CF0006|nr:MULTISPECIES: hypothetical protein [Mesorhizobium]ESY66307.1 hypothetical protein X742_19685 [Mesorhizobium sp. LNHC232B00]WJI38618.1 hypothetical protein NL534_33495 [Mesorhizobium opportunistum]
MTRLMITILVFSNDTKIQQLGPFPSEKVCTDLGKLMYETMMRTRGETGPVFTFSCAQST